MQHPNNLKLKVSLNKATGLLEVVDSESGKLIAIQESPDEGLLRDRREKLVERLMPDGSSVLVESSIDPSKLTKFKFMEYSSYVVDLICQQIVEGESLTDICKKQGFPSYAELCRWKKQVPEIQDQLDQARRDRAEGIRDKAYEEALQVDEDSVDSTKLRIDTLKWLAGTDNKERYGNAKAAVEVTQPLQIIVHTGIVRDLKDARPAETVSIPTIKTSTED